MTDKERKIGLYSYLEPGLPHLETEESVGKKLELQGSSPIKKLWNLRFLDPYFFFNHQPMPDTF